ncbi:MAG TPA: hypothetical protein VK395_07100 [Gemmataceae bacterium]|nr:hypothetical protein [Gemmataceae bacterium]
MTKSSESSDWYSGETGVVLPLVILAFAAPFWTRPPPGKKLQNHVSNVQDGRPDRR